MVYLSLFLSRLNYGGNKMDNTEKMLKQLTEVSGISGYEADVRSLVRQYLEPAGNISHDKLSSLVCMKVGDSAGPKVMLAAHMDECGFMVQRITKEGFIKFAPLGGWWDHVLLAQRVLIHTGKGDITGIIGAKPPHILTEEERKKMVEKKDMYIDIGACSQDEVEASGVRIGDPIVPLSEFTILAGGRTYLAKAVDDRIGCAVIIATMQRLVSESHPNTVYGVATVQEEVGLRGGRTSVDVVKPDVAFVIESGIATDVPGIEESWVKLNAGPVVGFSEPGMITNLKLRDLLVDIAQRINVPIQISADTQGKWGTDADVIHLYKSGVPTIMIAPPVRHIHSHTAIFHRDDFDKSVTLLTSVIKELGSEVVAGLTEW
jgi:putative aminopeptidase FrvX